MYLLRGMCGITVAKTFHHSTGKKHIMHILHKGSCKLTIFDDDTVSFQYVMNEGTDSEMCFIFSLFSEVAASLQPVFKQLISSAGYELGKARELDYYPWYVDTVRKTNEQPTRTR